MIRISCVMNFLECYSELFKSFQEKIPFKSFMKWHNLRIQTVERFQQQMREDASFRS